MICFPCCVLVLVLVFVVFRARDTRHDKLMVIHFLDWFSCRSLKDIFSLNLFVNFLDGTKCLMELGCGINIA